MSSQLKTVIALKVSVNAVCEYCPINLITFQEETLYKTTSKIVPIKCYKSLIKNMNLDLSYKTQAFNCGCEF